MNRTRLIEDINFSGIGMLGQGPSACQLRIFDLHCITIVFYCGVLRPAVCCTPVNDHQKPETCEEILERDMETGTVSNHLCYSVTNGCNAALGGLGTWDDVLLHSRRGVGKTCTVGEYFL